jgi:predicted nucleotidyltransferase
VPLRRNINKVIGIQYTMEEHLKKRPQKKVFQKKEINSLRNQAIEKIKSKLLLDEKIIKIILIGSSVKNSFGEYEPPGFRGSLFSDFDFIVFVEDNFEIPTWLDREPDGKPFPDDSINLAYRNKKFIDNKYDVEVFFIRESNAKDLKIQKQGEEAGIPITSDSKHKHLIVYPIN